MLGDRRWEQLCCIDLMVWTEPERMPANANWISPLHMFNDDNAGHQKIMFGTGNRKVLAVDADGAGTVETIFRADDAITGSFAGCAHPSLGLFQESLVPVGRTVEEIVFSSPAKQAWFHILKWMPARSVADLSLVCREWRAMIMTERFKRSHLIHANLNKSPRIMIIISPDERCIDLENFIGLDAPGLGPSIACSQPCHGLNVGTSHTGSFVCNPITAYCEHIAFEDDEDTSFCGRIGLGYNLETSKHLLVLTSYKGKNSSTLEYQIECNCKLRYVGEREWRPIDPPPRHILASTPPTYSNGKICWLVEPNLGPASPNCEIVAFDVQSEEFEVLQGPQCSHPVGLMSILCLQGALCVACSNLSVNVIDIWMMKDNTGTWLREYRIDLREFSPEYSSEETTPLILGIDPTDGRILLSTGRSLGYYDPKTAALETIYSLGIEKYDEFSPIICDESLVFTFGPA
jgi:F-box interacting protein